MKEKAMLSTGYYEIDDETKKKISSVSEIFYLKDLQQRKLILPENIEQESVDDPIRHILQYNREDAGVPVEERKPILLYLTSDGGDVDAGFALVDAIITSKTPVYTVNLGYWYSMAFLIGIAGHKRFAMPNAKFLLHDGTHFTYGSSSKVQDQMEFQRRAEQRIKQHVLDHTAITGREYDKKLRIEWYMFADEAKAKGIVDAIIGEDCDIDVIV